MRSTRSASLLDGGVRAIAVAVAIAIGGCTGGASEPAEAPRTQPTAAATLTPAPTPRPTPSRAPYTPVPATPSAPSIPGVSPECARELAGFAGAPQPVLETCASLDEVVAGSIALGIEFDWEEAARGFCGIGWSMICDSLPAPTPMTAERGAELCRDARPKSLYRVRTPVEPLKSARSSSGAAIVLVEVRGLDGRTRRDPGLKDESFYEFSWFVPGNPGSVPDEVDVVACVALDAFDLEYWHFTYAPTIDYPIYASNAIVWVVDAEDGARIGRPWRRRPPKAQSGDNWIAIGLDNPGQRAPREWQLVEDVTKLLGG